MCPDAEVVGRATSGEQALDIASTTTFDVAVVDYHMARMDGLQTAERLKGISPDCSVVVITAHDDARERILANPFVDHYLDKAAVDRVGELLRELVAR